MSRPDSTYNRLGCVGAMWVRFPSDKYPEVLRIVCGGEDGAPFAFVSHPLSTRHDWGTLPHNHTPPLNYD
jgi:hypothetical protein